MQTTTSILKKVYNKHNDRNEWAIVSKKDPHKILQWFGLEKPSEEKVQEVEKRIQFFKHVNASKNLKALHTKNSLVLFDYDKLLELDELSLDECIYGVLDTRYNNSYQCYEIESIYAQRGYGLYLVELLASAIYPEYFITDRTNRVTIQAEKMFDKLAKCDSLEHEEIEADSKFSFSNMKFKSTDPTLYDNVKLDIVNRELKTLLIEESDNVLRKEMQNIYAVASFSLETDLRKKYHDALDKFKTGSPKLDIFDLPEYGAIELKLIEIDPKQRGKGFGTKIMNDIIKWADDNNRIIVLSPSEIKTNKLIKWYKEFDFLENKGRNKDFRFIRRMIRYPNGLTRSKWIDANPSLTEAKKKEIGNPKFMTLEQLRRIANDPYFRGIDGADYDVIREEIEQRLWELEEKKNGQKFDKMIKDLEEMEEEMEKSVASSSAVVSYILSSLDEFNKKAIAIGWINPEIVTDKVFEKLRSMSPIKISPIKRVVYEKSESNFSLIEKTRFRNQCKSLVKSFIAVLISNIKKMRTESDTWLDIKLLILPFIDLNYEDINFINATKGNYMSIEKLKLAGIKIKDGKIAKADLERAVEILSTADTQEELDKWYCAKELEKLVDTFNEESKIIKIRIEEGKKGVFCIPDADSFMHEGYKDGSKVYIHISEKAEDFIRMEAKKLGCTVKYNNMSSCFWLNKGDKAESALHNGDKIRFESSGGGVEVYVSDYDFKTSKKMTTVGLNGFGSGTVDYQGEYTEAISINELKKSITEDLHQVYNETDKLVTKVLNSYGLKRVVK